MSRNQSNKNNFCLKTILNSFKFLDKFDKKLILDFLEDNSIVFPLLNTKQIKKISTFIYKKVEAGQDISNFILATQNEYDNISFKVWLAFESYCFNNNRGDAPMFVLCALVHLTKNVNELKKARLQ